MITELLPGLAEHLASYLGAYMFVLLVGLMFSGLPVAYALGGTALISGTVAVMVGLMGPPGLFLMLSRMWGGGGVDGTGIVHNFALLVIPCFLFMGTMLDKSGVAQELLLILQVLLRRVPGALAVSVAAMGTIMAATTGIAGASVVMMTLMALPTMLQRGYSPSLSTGTIAASATLGILIPPSMILVLLAFMLALPAGAMFLGAVFPGLVLSGLYIAYIVAISALRPGLAPRLPADAVHLEPTRPREVVATVATVAAIVLACRAGQHLAPGVNWAFIGFFSVFVATTVLGRLAGPTLLGGVLRGFVPPVFLIGMVLGSIFAGWATITEAAGVGAFGALILAVSRGSFSRKVLRDTLHATALSNAMYFFIFVGAIAFSTVFRLANGDELITGAILALDLGPWGFLLLLMALVFVMGFFFDFLEITLIVMPVFAPAIRALAPEFAPHLGLDAPQTVEQAKALGDQVMYWFAILVAVNLQTSFLTPPFGFSLFYMKGVAPSSIRMQQIYVGVAPFVVLQIIGLGLILLFPDIALWLPRQLIG